MTDQDKGPITDATLADWLALGRIPGVGPKAYAELLQRFGSPTEVLAASGAMLRAAGVPERLIDGLRHPPREAAAQDLAWAQAPGRHILTLADARYPALLKAIADPPPLLFVTGDPRVLALPQLAIVGSRNPTAGGRQTAREFAAHFARAGLTVTSGLALGVDAAAHDGALAAEGFTVAVAATGPDRVYPARHRDLARRIADWGALVTEWPPGTGPRAEYFPRRNRIISGLSAGVLVVEAGVRSGSLITARSALEQGREVFAMPGSIHNPLARGCHALIRQGATLVECANHVLDELGALVQATRPMSMAEPETADAPPLEAAAERLLESLGYDPVSVDTVVARSGLTAERVSSMLLTLELRGYVASLTGGLYTRTSKGV